MNAKRFFYVAAGILMLVIAYSVGATRVQSQSTGTFSGITISQIGGTVAISADGSIYARYAVPINSTQGPDGHMVWEPFNGPGSDLGWIFMGNVLGGTVATDQKTWTGVKDAYRK